MPYTDPEKQRTAQQKYYLKNKAAMNAQSKEAKKSKKRFLNGVKSYPCQDCNQSWPPCAMQLDHVDSKDKVDSLSKLVHYAGWSRVIEEAMKCELVCACCHAIRTTNRWTDTV